MSFSPNANRGHDTKNMKKDIETMLSAFSDIQRYFFHMLKKDSECPSFPSPNPHCDSISTNYHDFMAETTRFLALLMELKPIPSSVSVFKDDQGSYLWYNLNILQTKWASRNMVSTQISHYHRPGSSSLSRALMEI